MMEEEEDEVDERFDGVSVHTQADDHCLSLLRSWSPNPVPNPSPSARLDA